MTFDRRLQFRAFASTDVRQTAAELIDAWRDRQSRSAHHAANNDAPRNKTTLFIANPSRTNRQAHRLRGGCPLRPVACSLAVASRSHVVDDHGRRIAAACAARPRVRRPRSRRAGRRCVRAQAVAMAQERVLSASLPAQSEGREMHADVAQRERAEHRVAQRAWITTSPSWVREHADMVQDAHAAEHVVVAGAEGVHRRSPARCGNRRSSWARWP